MNEFIEIRRIFSVIMARRWLVITAIMAGALVGLLISRTQAPVYEATTTLLVGKFMQSTSVTSNDMQTSAEAARTYVDIALRQPVLDRVVTALDLDETWQNLKGKLQVKAIDGTQLIEIKAEGPSQETARAISDQVAAELITISPQTAVSGGAVDDSEFISRQIDSLKQELSNAQSRLVAIEAELAAATNEDEKALLKAERDNLQKSIIDWERNYVSLLGLAREVSATNNDLTIIEPAQASASAVRPNTRLSVVLGASVGLILVLGLIFLLEYLRDTYKTPEELYQAQELPVLGVVGKINGTQPSDKIVAYQKPFSPVTESYRMIRNKIQLRSGDQEPIRSILITSPTPGDGKSVTAVNLAVIMAKAGHKTILVDADMSQPSLHQMFNVEKYDGLADMLDPGVRQLDPYIKETNIRTLSLVTSGTPVADASERVSTERMSEVMMALEQKADIVIYDSPPALLAADAAILASQVDGVILVLRAGQTKRSDVKRAIVDLANVEANMLGCILNEAGGDQINNDYRVQKQRTLPARIDSAG